MQLDGRPMSGDIGAGATRAAVTLASHVAASHDRPPGTELSLKSLLLFKHILETMLMLRLC